MGGNGDDDCDDTDPDRFPGNAEACNGLDDDCDPTTNEQEDADLDGVSALCGGDCNDSDASVFTGASESCDSIDSDCDGSLVDEFANFDGDLEPDCIDPDDDNDGDLDATDCNDSDASEYTGAPESCDSIDSDCDGSLVDTFDDLDADGDPDCIDPDADGDGVDAAEDCDDLDAVSTTVAEDADCDDTITVDDCDDGDSSSTIVADDPDCDGLIEDMTVQGIDLLVLPGGTFDMGCTSSQSSCENWESPVHTVTLTHDFWLEETEVAQGQWQALMGNNPSNFGPSSPAANCGLDCPLETVNWWEALDFANAVSSAEGLAPCYTLTGCTNTSGNDMECSSVTVNSPTVYDCDGYRLPTEAEWEYAARAGADLYLYAGSNITEDVAWYVLNAGSTIHAVAGKLANDWGLHDMSGNVWEWSWDRYGSYPSSSPITNPEGPSTGSFRVRRGGGWGNPASGTRVAARSGSGLPGVRQSYLGFRLARTTPDP